MIMVARKGDRHELSPCPPPPPFLLLPHAACACLASIALCILSPQPGARNSRAWDPHKPAYLEKRAFMLSIDMFSIMSGKCTEPGIIQCFQSGQTAAFLKNPPSPCSILLTNTDREMMHDKVCRVLPAQHMRHSCSETAIASCNFPPRTGGERMSSKLGKDLCFLYRRMHQPNLLKSHRYSPKSIWSHQGRQQQQDLP